MIVAKAEGYLTRFSLLGKISSSIRKLRVMFFFLIDNQEMLHIQKITLYAENGKQRCEL